MTASQCYGTFTSAIFRSPTTATLAWSRKYSDLPIIDIASHNKDLYLGGQRVAGPDDCTNVYSKSKAPARDLSFAPYPIGQALLTTSGEVTAKDLSQPSYA